MIFYFVKEGENPSQDEIKEKFIKACVFYDNSPEENSLDNEEHREQYDETVKSWIYVVLHHDNKNTFLGLNPDIKPKYYIKESNNNTPDNQN